MMRHALAQTMLRPGGTAPRPPLPRAPVLGWDSFWPRGRGALPNVGDLPHRLLTSSGRAALHAALLQMRLAPGSGVLVPTYHCPTMVAPIVEAGHVPIYYPLSDDGLPDLARIALAPVAPRAMFVAHLFGLASSLAGVRAWCDERGILLVEDCAHCFFGQAGERPVGAWGDYATASLSKFFPVTEAGLLASGRRPLSLARLQAPGPRAQLKASWDVLDRSRQQGRLAGLTHALAPMFWLRDQRRGPVLPEPVLVEDPDDEGIRQGCDMGRIHEQPTLAARALYAMLPAGRIARRRRDNYRQLAAGLGEAAGAAPLRADPGPLAAPYVMPLVVKGAERADAVYTRLRLARIPVFRWDRLWPGAPRLSGDAGAAWSHQLLQLLCHQDLSPADLDAVVAATTQALAAEL